MNYALADIVRVTGATKRQVQEWAIVGVLAAEAGSEWRGSGTHRRFPRCELVVACFAHAFARRLRLPVGVVIDIAKLFRDALTDPRFAGMVERAIAGDDGLFVILRASGAPSFVIAYADGSTDDRLSIVAVDAKAEAGRDLLAQRVTEDLANPGSFSAVISASACLRGLREGSANGS